LSTESQGRIWESAMERGCRRFRSRGLFEGPVKVLGPPRGEGRLGAKKKAKGHPRALKGKAFYQGYEYDTIMRGTLREKGFHP